MRVAQVVVYGAFPRELSQREFLARRECERVCGRVNEKRQERKWWVLLEQQ